MHATLAWLCCSVVFNFLGRDFYNALSERDVEGFKLMIVKYLAGFVLGIPVFVYTDYLQQRLALEWREWMTAHLLKQYFADRSFYQLQAGAIVDNPDQRIASDVRQFTDAALGLSLTILNSLIDLVSFSGILYSIYPPLFAALLAYSIGGTVGSIALGKSLVGLNFNQEAVEADMRYGLVRVRENAESIAFYGGQNNEMAALTQRLRAVVVNYGKLLIASRNLDFFTSFYRFLIQLLPAAVVAPLFFAGKIEFGVITQSSSAFNHILNDVSLVVYQFETLAGFSAVVDRLGELGNGIRRPHAHLSKSTSAALHAGSHAAMDRVSINTPDGGLALVQDLSLKVHAGRSLLIMGPSGAGKTSVLRTLAGLWQSGAGTIYSYGLAGLGDPGVNNDGGSGSVLFLPQRPYMVLGSLRDQLLVPTDAELEAVLSQVQLGSLLQRSASALDHVADWSGMLSLGEQQRLAFARLLLAAPKLALLDEATSALDTNNESLLYRALRDSGSTIISVGHRPSLVAYHEEVLQLGGSQAGVPGKWQVMPAQELQAARAHTQ
ncbi:ABC transporter transmembrane region 2-domain-containing protein [Scenedesmus sp. NREL 46B-D3]|nr:ABC transporter transmembrane region 2-domain-containing protein [Scenedesmus sp. NREL 46B-D3]